MPLTGFLSQLDVVTAKELLPDVTDGIFLNSPLLAYIRANCLEKWTGNSIQEAVLYGRLPGGAYPKGSPFNITQPQTENAVTWLPKFYYVDVTLFLEDVEVTNAGPQAVIKLADSRLQQAALNMAEILGMAIFHHGQANGTGITETIDRAIQIQGLSEMLSDGVNQSWDGNYFPSWGSLPRSLVAPALNSPLASTSNLSMPTNVSSNVNGVITYPLLEEFYNSVCIGNEKPNLMVTTNTGMSYVKLKFQPAQRFESDSIVAGFTGIKFNGCMIMQDQYAPGVNGASNVNGNNSTAVGGSYATFPGETLFYLNTKHLKFYVSTSPKFGFGYTGWKPAQDNNAIAGQYLYGGPGLVCAPGSNRYHRQAYNITG